MSSPHRFRESRRKAFADLKRPRRRLGDELRPILTCPLCVAPQIGVIRWGEKTTRFECATCGLRFSLDLGQLAATLIAPRTPELFAEGLSDGLVSQQAQKSPYLHGGAAEELGEFIEKARLVKPAQNSTPAHSGQVHERSTDDGGNRSTTGPESLRSQSANRVK